MTIGERVEDFEGFRVKLPHTGLRELAINRIEVSLPIEAIGGSAAIQNSQNQFAPPAAVVVGFWLPRGLRRRHFRPQRVERSPHKIRIRIPSKTRRDIRVMKPHAARQMDQRSRGIEENHFYCSHGLKNSALLTASRGEADGENANGAWRCADSWGGADSFKTTELGQETIKKQLGAAAFDLNSSQLGEAKNAFKRLGAVGRSLTEAVDYFLRNALPAGGTRNFTEIAREFIQHRRSFKDCKARTITQYESYFKVIKRSLAT